MSAAPTPDRDRAEAAKLIYSARMLYVSAGLFAAAGAIWLISGRGTWIGVIFLGVAVAMAMSGRAVSTRV